MPNFAKFCLVLPTDGRMKEKFPHVWKHRSSAPSGPLPCSLFNFKLNLLWQGTGTANHLTLLRLFLLILIKMQWKLSRLPFLLFSIWFGSKWNPSIVFLFLLLFLSLSFSIKYGVRWNPIIYLIVYLFIFANLGKNLWRNQWQIDCGCQRRSPTQNRYESYLFSVSLAKCPTASLFVCLATFLSVCLSFC